jgi:hypothetical protein
MRKAKVNTPFVMLQWHGHDYPYYEDDAKENEFRAGDEVEVLKEIPNERENLYVIYNPRINESTVVAKNNIDFID